MLKINIVLYYLPKPPLRERDELLLYLELLRVTLLLIFCLKADVLPLQRLLNPDDLLNLLPEP